MNSKAIIELEYIIKTKSEHFSAEQLKTINDAILEFKSSNQELDLIAILEILVKIIGMAQTLANQG